MIVDAHLDLAWNALAEGRGFDAAPPAGYLVSRTALAEAGVGLCFATIFCAPAGAQGEDLGGGFVYTTPGEAGLMARAQLGYYGAIGLPLVRDRAELAGHLSGGGGSLAAVLLMEGADPVETPERLDWWAARGVRIVGPAWQRTRYSGGTAAPGGLTEAGFALLARMRSLGLVLDLSHLADQAVADSLAAWDGPLMASHSNARALVPGDRQLADPTIAEVGRRGGVIGISFCGAHLVTAGRPSIDDVVAHARHLAAVAGGPEHVGIGSDADGGFPAASSPLDRYAELGRVAELLGRHFGPEQVEGIMGGNWLRFLGEALPEPGPAVP